MKTQENSLKFTNELKLFGNVKVLAVTALLAAASFILALLAKSIFGPGPLRLTFGKSADFFDELSIRTYSRRSDRALCRSHFLSLLRNGSDSSYNGRCGFSGSNIRYYVQIRSSENQCQVQRPDRGGDCAFNRLCPCENICTVSLVR